MRIFCELRSIFPSPTGARKNTSNEQNVRSYYMLNHRIRGLLFHHKKNVILQLASIFLVRVFRNTLIPSVKMMLTMNKMFAGIICQTIEQEVDYSTAKKMVFWLLFSIVNLFSTVKIDWKPLNSNHFLRHNLWKHTDNACTIVNDSLVSRIS